MQDGEVDRKRRLGYAIRRAREQRGLTAPQLAELVGVGRDTVNAWERGASVPSMIHLGPLCEALHVRPDLFAILPEEPPSPVDEFLLVVDANRRAEEAVLHDPPAVPRRRRAKPPADEGSAA